MHNEVERFKNGFVFNCEKLRVREKPSLDGMMMGAIPNGENVQIDSEQSTDEFYKITTSRGVDGYCMKKYIFVEEPADREV